MKIGIVGYSHHNIDESISKKYLEWCFSEIIKKNKKAIVNLKDIEIVTGLTNIGIPKLAYQLADSLGYSTIGISAAQAFEVSCGTYPVDKEIIIGSKFGDESDTFIDYIDYLIRIGGGAQSNHETKLFESKCLKLGWDFNHRFIRKYIELQ